MFDASYAEWNHKRAKAIVDYYGYRFFFGKKVLDLGAGQGELGAVFVRLGAEVTCVDARESNINEIHKRHPSLHTIKLDLDNEWPFQHHSFDVVISAGLLCHLKHYDKHITNICNAAEHIVLETEVLDSLDPNVELTIYEEKTINDLSFHGQATLVSSNNIQNKLSTLGASFKRLDDIKINSGLYRYDWREKESGRFYGCRRLWFIRRDKFIGQRVDNHSKIVEVQGGINIPPAHMPNTPHERVLARLESGPRHRPISAPEVLPTPPPQYKMSPSLSPETNYFIHTPKNSDITDGVIRIFSTSVKNQDNPLIKDIIIMDGGNITFDMIFQKVNSITGPNDINIICGDGIFFDETISLAQNINHKEMYALTCWDWYEENNIQFRDKPNSQSAWIVRGPINNINGSFPLEAPSADSRIAYEFYGSGYEVLNPSKSIKVYKHNTNSIGGLQPVSGPHLFIIPTGM